MSEMQISQACLTRGEQGARLLQQLVSRRRGHFGHQLAWALMGDRPDRTRDFIYRVDLERDQPTVVIVSPRAPDTLGGAVQVKTRPYAPVFDEGEALDFVLRANPTRAVKPDPSAKRGAVHDVVMHLKHTLSGSGAAVSMPQNALVQKAGVDWLQAKGAGCGFQLTDDDAQGGEGDVIAHSYTQHVFHKRSGGKNKVHLSTIDFQGTLRVTDPALLRRALFEGVGRGKAYGAGLMMVRRARVWF